jgi:uncharacterized protein YcaQ
VFEVKALYLEANQKMSSALASDVGAALASTAAWHGTPEIRIRKTVPAAFGKMLKAAV